MSSPSNQANERQTVVENIDQYLADGRAVFDKNGKNYVFVKTGERFESRDVKVEQRTESRVAISGLSEGTEIALVDPTARTASAGSPSAPPVPASGGTK